MPEHLHTYFNSSWHACMQNYMLYMLAHGHAEDCTRLPFYVRVYLPTCIQRNHLCPSADSSMATDVGLCRSELPGPALQVGSQLPAFGSAVFWKDYLVFVVLFVGLNVAVRLNARVKV